ncbi:MAG: hypothetical protein FRX49_08339 [Trebouxia sp. A1-2]|nr:MAG: hypothetical protein FRX49_08339 [Trebouxia sp. A1-2]
MYFKLPETIQGLTYERGGTRAEAGEGQQAVPCLLHAHYHVVLRVQERRDELQAVALQHLDAGSMHEDGFHQRGSEGAEVQHAPHTGHHAELTLCFLQ